MKVSLSFFFLISCPLVFSQITLSEDDVESLPKRKALNNRKQCISKTNPNSNFYISMNTSSSYRKLETNNEFLFIPLNNRSNETSLFTNSFTLGINGKIYKNIGWDGAISFIQNGEQYLFSDTDTSFSYKTRYNYLSMPIRIHYGVNFSRKFGCKLGIGVIPSLFVNYKQDQEWQTTEGSKGTNSIKTNVGYNTAVFNLNAYLYFTYRLPANFGLFLGPEYRYQLSNSYQKTADYKHYSRAFGVTFGLYKLIN